MAHLRPSSVWHYLFSRAPDELSSPHVVSTSHVGVMRRRYPPPPELAPDTRVFHRQVERLDRCTLRFTRCFHKIINPDPPKSCTVHVLVRVTSGT